MTHHSQTPEQARQLDAICDRFEAELQADSNPRIEGFLADVEESQQENLLRELLALELAYQRKHGETLKGNQYRERFPNHTSLVDTVINAAQSDTVDFEHSDAASTGGTREFPFEFGNYTVLEEIAHGGMGVIYKARQKNPDRLVALKMIRAGELASREDVVRFHIEANAAAQLDHPNIVPVYEAGEHDGQHFFSMGFVEGESLEDTLRDGPLPPREAAELIHTIAKAVQYAHEKSIVHRDLKPANVLMDAGDAPRVTDFGLAKRIDADDSPTLHGQAMGTPPYMPPEQARGDLKQIGPLSDVYSLGATLYCLLTGRPPFQASSVVATLGQVLKQEPVSPRVLNPAIDRDLATICLKCLAKEPPKRYDSARDLEADLSRHLAGETILARPVSRLERTRRWCRRNPVVATLLTLVVVVVIAGFAGVSSQWWRAERNFDEVLSQKREVERQKQETEAALKEARKQRGRAEDEWKRAEKNLRAALQAVHSFYTDVSESPELLRGAPGTQELRATLLKRAREYFKSFVKQHADDPSLEYELAAAYFRLGTIYAETSESDKAMQSFDRVVEISKRHPDSDKFREELAAAYLNMSTMHHMSARSKEQLATQTKAREIFESLIARHPADRNYRYKHAFCQFIIGSVHRENTRYDEAIASFKKCIPTFETLLAQDNNDEVRARLAGAYCYLAVAYTTKGELAKAAPLYGKTMATLKRLDARKPMGPETDLLLADCHLWMGIHHREANRLGDAMREADTAIDMARKLLPLNRKVPRTRVLLGLGYDYKASYLDALNKRADSLSVRRQAIDVFSKLLEEHPRSRQFKSLLARNYYNRALTHQNVPDFRKAKADFDQAREYQEELYRAAPEFDEYTRDLARTIGAVGTMYNLLGQSQPAIAHYNEAIRFLSPLHEKTRSRDNADLLSSAYADLGLAHIKRRTYRDALAAYEKAILILKPFIEDPKYRELADLHDGHASLLSNMGIVFERMRRFDRAVSCYDEAIAIRLRLSKTPKIRIGLGGCYCNRGNTLRGMGNLSDAISSYGQAIAELTAVIRKGGDQPQARGFLMNSYGARATTYQRLGRYQHEAHDWLRMMDLTPDKQQVRFFLRAFSALARAGKHSDAVREAEKIMAKPARTLDERISVAKACSWFADIARRRRDPQKVADRYLDTALTVLRPAKKEFLQSSRHLHVLKTDRYFATLRNHKGFRRLLRQPLMAEKPTGDE